MKDKGKKKDFASQRKRKVELGEAFMSPQSPTLTAAYNLFLPFFSLIWDFCVLASKKNR